MLEIKNTTTEIRNAFNWLISRLDVAEERISELDDMTIETSNTESQREKKTKNQNKISTDSRKTKKCAIDAQDYEREKKQEKGKEI